MNKDLRVLYVDDEPDIRTIAVLALGLDPGIEVRAGASADEAIALLADWVPDIILLDVMMPVVSGPDLAKRIREDARFARTPIVFMTARARQSDIQGYHADGVAGVIVKPFDPIGLAGELRAIFARAR